MNTLAEYRVHLKGVLSPKRYHHSVCVEEQAVYLAEQWGADKDKAAIAGLLHDICKEMPEAEQLQYLAGHGILVDKYQRTQLGTWHGSVGALFLEYELQITDREVLNAVKYHVLGRANMTLLEKVIFVADYTSAERDFPHCSLVRDMLPQQKEEAIFEIMRYTLEKKIDHQDLLLPEAVESYNYFLLERREIK